MTLRELTEAHPEWLDLELVVLSASGETQFVDGGNVSLGVGEYTEDDGSITDVLIFAANEG